MPFTIQTGHARGETLRLTDPANITAGIERAEALLRDSPNSRSDFHREWLAAARAELAFRRARRFTKGIHSAKAVREALDELAPITHLVTPSRDCVRLHDGTAIAVTFLQFDGVVLGGKSENRDVYVNREGDLSLRKEALNQIARAAGVDWLPAACGRVGDRSHPFYVEYKAAAKWLRFDASEHTEADSRAVDLRDKSVEIVEMTNTQLAHDRRFILALAESRSKARVIRELGVSLTYSAQELEKPFAILRLVHTGRTRDKALNREMALQTQRSMTGSKDAMFGKEQAR